MEKLYSQNLKQESIKGIINLWLALIIEAVYLNFKSAARIDPISLR